MSGQKLTDYDYLLAEERIAQEPVPTRDQSRLMIVDRESGKLEHRRFFEIGEYLNAGDLLVLNDTRVIRARLEARKETGGKLEIFLLRDLGENRWETLIRGKVSAGMIVILEGDRRGVVERVIPDGKRVVRFDMDEDLYDYMEQFGVIPLPPYIQRNGNRHYHEMDLERYQTVYSKQPGAVAAPTAGLHFTEDLLSRLRDQGVRVVSMTLHVGYGTFKAVTAEAIEDHKMDSEYYSIDPGAARAVQAAMDNGRRIIAVGSTSTRALESAVESSGRLSQPSGNTDLFIYPGYRFRAVKGLVTNFHLPKSTLLMLVAAFLGKDKMDRAYEEAMKMDYRFYSYGDAMLIL